MSILPCNQLSLTETFTEYSIIIENSGIKAYGIPCCPHDFSLPMKPESSTSHLCGGSKTFKFVCPKIQWKKSEDGKHRRRHNCENPCTDSSFGRMTYIYPRTIRGTDLWNATYKNRGVIEQTRKSSLYEIFNCLV